MEQNAPIPQASAALPSAPLGAGLGDGPSHVITHGPSFAMLRVDLSPGQVLVAEAGSMVARHSQVNMQVKLNASPRAGFWAKLSAFFVAILRKVIGGETFFVNHFGTSAPGSVWIAPTLAGQITHRRLAGETLILSTGAYLGHIGDLDIRMRFGGLRGLLAKEGAFFLEVSGHGDLWFNSYGGIEAIDIHGPYMVDNGHLVGFEGQLDFNIRSAGGGLMGLFASGEGIVCEFQGQGRVYIQSRNVGSLVSWLSPLLPG